MESKDGEERKSVIDAVSKEDEDVSEILFSLDSKIVEAPANYRRFHHTTPSRKAAACNADYGARRIRPPTWSKWLS